MTQETFNTEELKLHIEQIGDLALISATVGLASSLTSLLHGLSQILFTALQRTHLQVEGVLLVWRCCQSSAKQAH